MFKSIKKMALLILCCGLFLSSNANSMTIQHIGNDSSYFHWQNGLVGKYFNFLIKAPELFSDLTAYIRFDGDKNIYKLSTKESGCSDTSFCVVTIPILGEWEEDPKYIEVLKITYKDLEGKSQELLLEELELNSFQPLPIKINQR